MTREQSTRGEALIRGEGGGGGEVGGADDNQRCGVYYRAAFMALTI